MLQNSLNQHAEQQRAKQQLAEQQRTKQQLAEELRSLQRQVEVLRHAEEVSHAESEAVQQQLARLESTLTQVTLMGQQHADRQAERLLVKQQNRELVEELDTQVLLVGIEKSRAPGV